MKTYIVSVDLTIEAERIEDVPKIADAIIGHGVSYDEDKHCGIKHPKGYKDACHDHFINEPQEITES